MAPRVTVVSNGHGEDAIGTALALGLRARGGVDPVAVPLVGLGRAYAAAGISRAGPMRALPSAGLTLHTAASLAADLRAGWLPLTARQVGFLARLHSDVLLVVGDVFAQALAALAHSRARFVYQPLVSILQSEGSPPPVHRLAMERITYPERELMRQRFDRVYVRDELTAAWLRRHAVPHAIALGNPAVDAVATDARTPWDPCGAMQPGPALPATALSAAGADAPQRPEAAARHDPGGHLDSAAPPSRLVLLPGSRGHAPRSLARMLEATLLVAREVHPDPVLAWAGDAAPGAPGWAWSASEGAGGRIGAMERDGVRVEVRSGALRCALQGARVALATAGTGAEQAAAAGVPVVSFAMPPEHTERFLEGQKRLLADALTVVPDDPAAIATAALALWRDDALHGRAARIGRLRMGPPGGTRAIVEDLLVHAERLGALDR